MKIGEYLIRYCGTDLGEPTFVNSWKERRLTGDRVMATGITALIPGQHSILAVIRTPFMINTMKTEGGGGSDLCENEYE